MHGVWPRRPPDRRGAGQRRADQPLEAALAGVGGHRPYAPLLGQSGAGRFFELAFARAFASHPSIATERLAKP